MSETTPRMRDVNPTFDEALLSGYVDGELTQAEEQKVRIFLEDDAAARAIVEDIRRLRQAARGTRFKLPPDTQWDERPRGPASAVLRRLGWVLLLGSGASVLGFGAWQLAVGPFAAFAKLIAFGTLFGLGSLFVSVLADRLRAAATDRYRRVEK